MAGKSYLPTEPGTALEWRGRWCAGHRWRDRGRVAWWLHHAGHWCGLLRNQAPRHRLVYLESKADDA